MIIQRHRLLLTLLICLSSLYSYCQSENSSEWYAELWGNSYYSIGKSFSNKSLGFRLGFGMWPTFSEGGLASPGYALPIIVHKKMPIGSKILELGLGYTFVKSFFENEDLSDLSSNSFYNVSLDYPLIISKKGRLFIGLHYSYAHSNPKRYSAFPGLHIRYHFKKPSQ